MLTPSVGQYIKCLLSNNSLIEGYVESWTSVQVQLKSLDGKSILIINRPDDVISVIKIALDSAKKQENLTDLDSQFKKAYDEPSGSDLRTKKLAELRILQAEQDKKNVSDKLKDHTIGQIKKVQYGYPGFIKIKST